MPPCVAENEFNDRLLFRYLIDIASSVQCPDKRSPTYYDVRWYLSTSDIAVSIIVNARGTFTVFRLSYSIPPRTMRHRMSKRKVRLNKTPERLNLFYTFRVSVHFRNS